MQQRQPKGSSGTLRIIGGQWRGRKLSFPARDGLRPTADRVRETVFNWLAPSIQGTRCLDMFAGSGAMGLEALSRGAESVAFIERDRSAALAIQNHLKTLNAVEQGNVVEGDAMSIDPPKTPFDIVFVDPPFGKDMALPALQILANGFVDEHSRIYLEVAISDKIEGIEQLFDVLKDKKAGQVRYLLLALHSSR